VRPHKKIAIAASVLVAVTALVGTFGLRYYLAHRSLSFDRARWLAASHGYCAKSERGRMADDLVHNHLRAGMPLRQVRRLLGRPDYSADGVWSYDVNQEEGLLAICVYLELHTHAGRLQDAEVYRDY
jgi:outer membrane protein assembly factor BamE (lipoprotein component of BamABCDE complex)